MNDQTTTQAPAAAVPAAVAATTPTTTKRVVTRADKKAAKRAAKAEKKAKAVAKHKPSTVARTDDNPARSIVPVRFKAAYSAHNDTCGRPLNMALKAATTTRNDDGREVLDVKALKAIASAHGIWDARYEALNNGQKRMNVGNKLAGLLKAGKKVTIGKQVFANADKALAAPKAA